VETDALSILSEYSERFLKSLSFLSHAAKTSASCLTVVRAAIEESNSSEGVSGPQRLANIVIMAAPANSIQHVFSILADLVHGATLDWLLDTVLALKMLQREEQVWSKLLFGSKTTANTFVRVVGGLVDNMSKILFSADMTEHVASDVIAIIGAGVSTCMELLTTALSTQDTNQGDVSYASAAAMLDCVCCYLKQIGPVAELHLSTRVQNAALQSIDYVVKVLASNHRIEECLIQFVSSPVTLSIASSLVNLREESDGASILPSSENAYFSAERAKTLLLNKVECVQLQVIDIETSRSKGWIGREDDSMAPLQAALSALQLLNQWSLVLNSISYKKDEILRLSPFKFLEIAVSMPPQVRLDGSAAFVWNSSRVPLYSIMHAYFRSSDSIIENELAVAALDFFAASFASAENQQSTIFRSILESKSYRDVVENCASRVEHLSRQKQPPPSEALEISCVLRSLDLLCLFLKFLPLPTYKVLDKNEASSINVLVKVACTLTSFLLSKHDGEILREVPIGRVRLATGCLHVIREVWTCYRMGTVLAEFESLKQILEGDFPLMTSVAACVFGDTIRTSLLEKRFGSEQRYYGTFLAFVSASGTSQSSSQHILCFYCSQRLFAFQLT
jgi:hypothetical protein